MPEITISEEMHNRVTEFKKVIEALFEEEIDFDTNVDLILNQGLHSMLADMLASQDQTTLLHSLQQLSSRYPAQVYDYIAEVLDEGAAAQEERESIRRQMGFSAPKHTEGLRGETTTKEALERAGQPPKSPRRTSR